jgi:hypothetical protein
MKEYLSIPGVNSHTATKGHSCIAFKKYDGSNLRFEWDRKKGWHLFGTRRRLFDKSDPEYGCAIDLFLNKYASGVEAVISKEKHFRGVREVICYAEFFGPWSFGGQHDPKHPALDPRWTQGTALGPPNADNSPKDVVIFDVNVHKKGLLSPRDFVNYMGHLPVAEVVYEGNLGPQFIEDVRQGTRTAPGWVSNVPLVEGVICKGLIGKAPHGIWMTKIKTNAYLEELKKRFDKDWHLYWE